MGSPTITIRIAADDKTAATFALAQANIKLLGDSTGASGQAMTRSFNDARSAAMLLGEETGVRLNRHLSRVLSTSSLLGPILQAAFPVAASVAFATVAIEAFEKIQALVTDKAFKDAATETYGRIREQLEKAAGAARQMNRELQLAQTGSEAGRKALEFKFKIEDATDAMEPVKDVESEIDRLQAKLKLMNTNPWFRSPREIDETTATLKNLYLQLGVAIENVQTKEGAAAIARISSWKVSTEAAKKYSEMVASVFALQTKRREIPMAEGQAPWSAGLMPTSAATALYSGSVAAMTLYKVQTDQNTAIQAAQQIYEQTATAAQKYGDTIDVLVELFYKGRISEEQFAIAAVQAGNSMGKNNVMWRQFGQEVGEATKQGLLMGRSWSDVMKSMLASVSQLIIQVSILNRLESAFGKGGSGGGVGGFFTALVGGLSGKAGGGFVGANMPYMVGERGPELFVPGMSGTIIPNGVGGGVTNYYNIDARGAAPGVDRDILRALKQTEDRAVARSISGVRERSLRGAG